MPNPLIAPDLIKGKPAIFPIFAFIYISIGMSCNLFTIIIIDFMDDFAPAKENVLAKQPAQQ